MSSRFPKVRLGRVAKIRSGDAISKTDMTDDGVPVFGANGQMGYAPQANFPQGALCVGRVGSCGAVNHHKRSVFVSDNALVLQPREGASVSFLEYVLRCTDFAPMVNQGAMPLLTGGDLAELRVPFPAQEVQTAIANYLDAKTAVIDALIAKKELLIEELKKYEEAVIAEAVKPREGWSKAKLKGVVCALPKSTRAAGEAVEAGAYPFFVSGQQVKACEAPDYVDCDAVVLATGGGPAVHLATGKFSFSTDCWALVAKPGAHTGFIYYLLLSRKEALAELGFRGAGIKHLDKDWLLNSDIAAPSGAEQAAIAAALSRQTAHIRKLVENAESAISEARKLRSSLISEAVTGKLTLPR